MALGVRQLLVQVVSAGAVVVLARVLEPGEFGFYAVTVFLMNVVLVAGDAGLAASLVREEAEPDERDFEAVFTFQQAAAVAIAVAGAGVLLGMPALVPRDGPAGLLAAALVALVLMSFVTASVARLERRLRFESLAALEVAQALAFNGVAVAGALAGFGANAMAAALVARAATAVLIVRRVEPWPRRRTLDWSRVRSRLLFGVAYQATTVLGLVREAVVPVYIGATIGSAAVGGVFFAQLLATHVMIAVSMLQRVLLPVFARLQADRAALSRAVESASFAVAALVVPMQTTVLALQEPIVRIVFGEQWLDSLGVFRWLWAAAVLDPQLIVAVALLNSLGRSDRTLRAVAAGTLLGWAAAVPLLLWLGPVGYGVAAVLLLGIKWSLLRDADAAAGVSSTAVVAPVWIAGAASGTLTWLAAWMWPVAGVADLAMLLLVALAIHAAVLAVLAFERVRRALAWLRRQAQDATDDEGRNAGENGTDLDAETVR
jgi:O-antigen/teichoic acid export membrane protein